MTKSPSGALSPYYYKGGYFHGIHYGGYFHDSQALFAMMEKEESFILKSPERRRILIDLYETDVSAEVSARITEHIRRISDRIVKLAVAGERKKLCRLRRVMEQSSLLEAGQLYFCTDMEEGKTWLMGE